MIIWFVKNEKWEKFSSRSKIQNYFQEKRKIFEFKCYEIFIHVVVKAVVGWLGGHIKRSVICCLLSEAVNQWRSKASASSSNCFPPKLQTLFCCLMMRHSSSCSYCSYCCSWSRLHAQWFPAYGSEPSVGSPDECGGCFMRGKKTKSCCGLFSEIFILHLKSVWK